MLFRIVSTSLAVLGLASATVATAAPINLSAEASSPGNSPHLSIIHLAEIAGEAGIANLQVQEGQTLTNSILNVAQGKTDIAPLPMVLAFLLEKGRGPYSKQGKKGAALAANLRALYPYNAGAYGLFSLQSTGIRTWQDLKGRTIFNGPPRGAALVNARQTIQLNTGMKDGKGYTGKQVNWGQLATLLVDGSVDGFVLPLTFPSPRVTVAASAGKINIISTPKAVFESEAFQRLLKAPGNVPIVVKEKDMGYSADSGVTLISEDGTFRGMGTAFTDVVNKKMDAGLVKSLVALYIKNMDRMRARAPYVANIGLGILDAKKSGFCGPLKLKYHVGAIAAWEEAGYHVPDCAK